MRRLIIHLILIGGLLPVLAAFPVQRPQPEGAPAGEQESRLHFAAAQHEVILLLLEEGRYREVLPEFRKILELGFEGEQEKLVVQAAWQIVEALRKAHQFSLAHQVVEETLEQTEQGENRFALLMLKGKIYMEEGNREAALRTFRSAQELSRKLNLPR